MILKVLHFSIREHAKFYLTTVFMWHMLILISTHHLSTTGSDSVQ